MARRYLHGDESDSTIALTYTDLADATSFIIKRARALIAQLIEVRQREEPPFLAKELAPLLGVKNIVRADLGDEDGMLLRLANGYVIQVNANHHDVRQNFSCAHEIGHIILDEFVQQSSGTDFRRPAGVTEKAKERLCDTAAAELLMPEPSFNKYLNGFGLSVDSIEFLARVFKVSIPAAAIRVAEVSLEPCLAILWKPWRKRKSKYLRAAWVVGSRREGNKDWFMPRNTCVAKDSKLYKAYESDSPVRSFKFVHVNNEKRRCYVESKGFGLNERRYVISLAFLNR